LSPLSNRYLQRGEWGPDPFAKVSRNDYLLEVRGGGSEKAFFDQSGNFINEGGRGARKILNSSGKAGLFPGRRDERDLHYTVKKEKEEKKKKISSKGGASGNASPFSIERANGIKREKAHLH